MNLGDFHNFGQCVKKSGEWVLKPRPIFWEILFLSSASPIRKLCSELAISQQQKDPFLHFPDLSFRYDENEFLPYCGSVEFFTKSELSSSGETVSEALGRLLAISLVFGLSDLHLENIIVSSTRKGEGTATLIFPIDIETVFEKVDFLSSTHLLKGHKDKNQWKAINNLNVDILSPAKIIFHFIETYDFFLKNKSAIETVLNLEELRKVPIRRLIRSTSEYLKFMRTGEAEVEFAEEELLQMQRGDVPYFLSYIGREGIFQVGKNEIVEVPKNSKLLTPKLKLNPREGLLNFLDEKHVKINCLQILRNLSTAIPTSQYGDFQVNFKENQIFLERDNSWKLVCDFLTD